MQISTKPFALLLSILIVSCPFDEVLAKAAKHKKGPILAPPLIPMFDAPGRIRSPYFQIGIERKRYIYLRDPNGILQARTGRFELSAQKSSLRGRVSEQKHYSSIGTVEHGVRARFSVDLQELTASFAPSLSQLLAAQVETAKRKADDELPKSARIMDEQLQRQRPSPAMPPLPLRGNSSVLASNSLESALAESKSRAAQATQSEAQQIAHAQPQSKGNEVAMPSIGKVTARMPNERVSSPLAMPTATKPDTASAEQLMNGQLGRKKGQMPSDSAISAALKRAKDDAQNSVEMAQPALDSILTSLRAVPSLRVPNPAEADKAVKADLLSKNDATMEIEWDKWHARFAQLAQLPILKEIGKNGNPKGSNTVEVTVKSNQKVIVRVLTPGPEAFDRAMLQAYRSLDGKTDLVFPAGSRRTEITFLIDNKHTGTGTPSRVTSKTSIGDKETVRFHR